MKINNNIFQALEKGSYISGPPENLNLHVKHPKHHACQFPIHWINERLMKDSTIYKVNMWLQ